MPKASKEALLYQRVLKDGWAGLDHATRQSVVIYARQQRKRIPFADQFAQIESEELLNKNKFEVLSTRTTVEPKSKTVHKVVTKKPTPVQTDEVPTTKSVAVEETKWVDEPAVITHTDTPTPVDPNPVDDWAGSAFATQEMVNHPDHYKMGSLECIDVMQQMFTHDEVKAFCKLNAFKYLFRAGKKGSAEEDVRKAQWYLDKLKELDRW